MIEEIINKNLERIENDLKEINDIQNIDFIDLFPVSEEHKKLLDDEAMKIARIIKETERGNIYLLNTPLKTKYGRLCKVIYFISDCACCIDLIPINSKHRAPTVEDIFSSDNLEVVGNIHDNPELFGNFE